MSQSSWQRRREPPAQNRTFDPFPLGRRLRHIRKERGLTLAQVSEQAGIASSQLSLIENGKREAKISTLQRLAAVYEASLDDLTATEPNHRTQLEIELDAAMTSSWARGRGLPQVRISPRIPMDALEALVALHREVQRAAEEHVATPEEARRANTELRAEMRAKDNYFPEIEMSAAKLLRTCGYETGPLTQSMIGTMTSHLGFTIHHVGDLPHSTRSVTDLRAMRIYLPARSGSARLDGRTVLLQALGHHVLGHDVPTSYKDFLRQRIETNYFAAALLMPERSTVAFLTQAKERRELAVEDLRDVYSVSHEAAGHRLTNLITHHLDIPVHFQKVHESGVIYKAYENDGVVFPADHTGAIEGQPVCRHWTSREVFGARDKFNSFDQYTDTPAGTFWCTARVDAGPDGSFSTSVGVPYAHSRWFRGRTTPHRSTSTCPDESCCRRPPAALLRHWSGHAWPSARAHAHLLAALPPGAFPGVDETEVYRFLTTHAQH